MQHTIVVQHVSSSVRAGRTDRYEKSRIRLGRRPDNDVAFDPHKDRAASGYHAEVSVTGDRLFLKDLDSANGTWVNGRRIDGQVELKPGDTVRLGEQGPEMRFSLLITDQPPPPPPSAMAPQQAKRGIGQATMIQAISSAAGRERARMNRRLMVLLIVLVAVLGALGYVYYDRVESEKRARSELEAAQKDLQQRIALRDKNEKALRAELDAYRTELAGVRDEGKKRVGELIVELQKRDDSLKTLRERQDLSEKERKMLMEETERKVTALNKELREAEEELRKKPAAGAADWSEVANKAQSSVFLVVAQWPQEGKVTIGTAFVLKSTGLLGTNAHVAKGLEGAPVQVAIQNVTGKIYLVKSALANPKWTPTAINGPDVALIEIDTKGDSLPEMTLATDEEVQQLKIGTQLGTIGYPGELLAAYLSQIDRQTNRVKTAVATFKDGWIGRITDYTGAAASPKDARYIQHSASLTGGTSGSPMFTRDGKVVAINHAGETNTIVVRGKTPQEIEAATVASAAEIGYAIRIDELRDYWRSTGK